MAIKAETQDIVNLQTARDVEDLIWSMTDKFHSMSDYIESGEPLQARQSFAELKAYMDHIETYIEGMASESAK